MEPFLVRALAAGLGLAAVAAPLGCFLVWQRMAFFGETVAHASLIGVALALAANANVTGAALGIAVLVAATLVVLSRQQVVPVDSLLSVLAHGSLALGVIATALAQGGAVDIVDYLFGDIYAVSVEDLAWLAAGGVLVLVGLAFLWQPLLLISVDAELAAAEGIRRERVKALVLLLLAVVVAIAIKVVGVLLTVAFLIMPATAARPAAATPEAMAVAAVGVAAMGVVGGLALSLAFDTPGGASIVVVLTAIAGCSLTTAALRRR